MNDDMMAGAATDLGGKIKEGIGTVSGDDTMRAEGQEEQLAGQVRQSYGEVKGAVEDGIVPLIDDARQFLRERPFVAAALAGVLGIALINTLRAK